MADALCCGRSTRPLLLFYLIFLLVQIMALSLLLAALLLKAPFRCRCYFSGAQQRSTFRKIRSDLYSPDQRNTDRYSRRTARQTEQRFPQQSLAEEAVFRRLARCFFAPRLPVCLFSFRLDAPLLPLRIFHREMYTLPGFSCSSCVHIVWHGMSYR